MLHLPETAHLYVLLNCAQYSQEKFLDPELETYLIQTLLRYSEMVEQDDCSEMMGNIDLYKAMELNEDEYLKDIADYCLICTGLMSGQFIFEEISFERLQEIGQRAFSMLSDHTDKEDNIFIKLSRNFTNLVEILQCSQNLISDQGEYLLSANSTYSAKTSINKHELSSAKITSKEMFQPTYPPGFVYH